MPRTPAVRRVLLLTFNILSYFNYMIDSYVNDTSKPLIFLGSNIVMEVFSETCERIGIEIAGIIDNDYYGNTKTLCGIPIIDTENSFDNLEKLKHYRDKFNFFCAVTWLPISDSVSSRNTEKRNRLIKLINDFNLNSISLIDPFAKISKTLKIGRGCFIDGCTHIMPRVTIGNNTMIYTHTNVAHDAKIGNNCVIQRMCIVPPCSTLEDNVFFGTASKGLKTGAIFGENTFIHEGIYIKRGTVKNEVVSIHSANMRRISTQYIE